mmetsp:Transcript_138567/g.252230  ORF Transcript_138567/g.252230 Transcript_138567/m.252230 type:complete len:134 (+) Transcript_138567:2-403(+)
MLAPNKPPLLTSELCGAPNPLLDALVLEPSKPDELELCGSALNPVLLDVNKPPLLAELLDALLLNPNNPPVPELELCAPKRLVVLVPKPLLAFIVDPPAPLEAPKPRDVPLLLLELERAPKETPPKRPLSPLP